MIDLNKLLRTVQSNTYWAWYDGYIFPTNYDFIFYQIYTIYIFDAFSGECIDCFIMYLNISFKT